MSKALKLGYLVGVFVILFIGAMFFVEPKRALSAALMRNCIGVVKDHVRGAGTVSVFSVAAIQPAPNEKKTEDFDRATQAVIKRGGFTPSEPEVLVEFETDRSAGKALCKYDAMLNTNSGTYSGVSLRSAQVGISPISEVDVLLAGSFNVGYLDRVLSLFPIIGSEQKFYLD
ncbi:hypothetical protein ACTXNP_01005 [Pseudomonas helleri]|uniref:hypothetical protein n=1 Tax=Pseudomonas helleri TaxID=1608996 RepID=UPI003FD331CA